MESILIGRDFAWEAIKTQTLTWNIPSLKEIKQLPSVLVVLSVLFMIFPIEQRVDRKGERSVQTGVGVPVIAGDTSGHELINVISLLKQLWGYLVSNLQLFYEVESSQGSGRLTQKVEAL